jgi:hypothetical protein
VLSLSKIEHQLEQAKDSQSPLLRTYLDNLGGELVSLETILGHNVDLDFSTLPNFTPIEKPSHKLSTPHDEKIEEAFTFFNDVKMSDLSSRSAKAVVESDGRKSCL